jgi:hypothetical protein
MSTYSNYTAPSIKATAKNSSVATHITNLRLFKVLDKLRPTAKGLDNIPVWFLQIIAPLFTALLADLMNLSLFSSVLPQKWKLASNIPILKYPLYMFCRTKDPFPSHPSSPESRNTLLSLTVFIHDSVPHYLASLFRISCLPIHRLYHCSPHSSSYYHDILGNQSVCYRLCPGL